MPGVAWPVDIDGTVILGSDEAGNVVLFDMADASSWTIAAQLEANVLAIGGGYVVGSVPNSTGKKNNAFVWDLNAGDVVSLGFADRRESWVTAVDGHRIAGWAEETGGVFVADVLTGRIQRIDSAPDRDRTHVEAMSGDRLAGTSGEFDAERAWLVDLGTGTLLDLHALVDGSNSSAWDLDGDLVVGSVETPLTFARRPWIYDVATGVVIDLGRSLGVTGAAMAVDGTWVAGQQMGDDGLAHPFVYDVATGRLHPLPEPAAPGAGIATAGLTIAMSGDLVLGQGYQRAPDGTVTRAALVWNLAGLP